MNKFSNKTSEAFIIKNMVHPVILHLCYSKVKTNWLVMECIQRALTRLFLFKRPLTSLHFSHTRRQ